MAKDGYRGPEISVNGFGPWREADDLGWVWMTSDGCGWPKMDLEGWDG